MASGGMLSTPTRIATYVEPHTTQTTSSAAHAPAGAGPGLPGRCCGLGARGSPALAEVRASREPAAAGAMGEFGAMSPSSPVSSWPREWQD